MTYVGTKRGLIEFLEKNIKEDEVCISTSFMKVVEKKRDGLQSTFQYAKGTFAKEDGCNVLMRNKNLGIWWGPKSDIHADSKILLNLDKAATTKKAAKKNKKG